MRSYKENSNRKRKGLRITCRGRNAIGTLLRLLSAHASASAVAPPLPPPRADGVAAPAVPGDAAAALGAAA